MLIPDHEIQRLDQPPEIRAVTVDTERIAQRDARLTARRLTGFGSLLEGFFALGFVVEIPLKEQKLGIADHRVIDVLGADFGRNPEIGVHRPLAIGRHENHRARCGQLTPRDRRIDKGGAVILGLAGIELAQLIVVHTTNEPSFQTQVPDPRNRVRNRTTRGQRAFPHRIIEQFTTALLNQLHHPLLDAHLVQKRIVALG